MTIARMFRYLLKDNMREDFLQQFRPLADHVIAAEPDTLIYLVHRDREDPNHVLVYAAFTDDAALGNHKSSAVYRTVHDGIAPLVASSLEIATVVMRAKGLDLAQDSKGYAVS